MKFNEANKIVRHMNNISNYHCSIIQSCFFGDIHFVDIEVRCTANYNIFYAERFTKKDKVTSMERFATSFLHRADTYINRHKPHHDSTS